MPRQARALSKTEAAPARAARKPPPVPAHTAEVNRFIAAYIMGVANRLANGASNHYRSRHNLGMAEWRTMMAIGESSHRIVREVAEMADLDYAAASKSLKVLTLQGLVEVEQTRSRGRAAIAKLTPQGQKVYAELCQSAMARQERLLATFSKAEVAQLWSLLRRIEAQTPFMNQEP
jgi:DNA-binding MarR family transcriptional regulator